MRAIFVCFSALSVLSVGAAGYCKTNYLDLVERGCQGRCAIVMPSDPTPSQEYAAEEMAKYVRLLTDVTLDVRRSSGLERSVGGHLIFIEGGDASLGEDGFRLTVKNGDLRICGGARGVLYGVYEVLETYGGVGWFASWHETVPKIDVLRIPGDLDCEQKPAFEMREPLWYDALNGDFAARLRLNGNAQRLEARHGGQSHRFEAKLGSCHTFARLVPVDEFFDSHPEYFSMIDGKRTKAFSQLCLSNPDVLRLVTERVKEAFRRDPGAKYVSVTQNDWQGYCTCPACKAVDDEEESHAGTMVRFVNAVAEAVEKEFPDKMIETFAYQYTRKPPKKTRVRHNVMPCLCTIECDFSRPLVTSPDPENVRFRDDIRGWSAQTDQLYLWDYTCNFSHYPLAFPNVYVLQDNIRFFRDNRVVSLFEQGAYQGRHADFAELKTWLLAKWMWNPDLPMEPLLDRFFKGYYGKAAPFARAYFEHLHRQQRTWAGNDPAHSLKIFDGVFTPALDDAFLAKAANCWKRAEAAVRGEDAVYGYNVRMSAFSTAYARFMRQARTIWVTRDPARYDAEAGSVASAKWLLDRMNEAKDIRISELQGGHDSFVNRCRYVLENPHSTAAADVGRAGATAFSPWGSTLVDDVRAEGKKSLKLAYDNYEWAAALSLNLVAYDPDVKYKVRVRLRADLREGALPDAEVFWSGVYDPVRKADVGASLSVTAKECGDDWKWFDVCTICLNDSAFLWVAPGRFKKGKYGENPAHRGVWVDCVEFRRVTK